MLDEKVLQFYEEQASTHGAIILREIPLSDKFFTFSGPQSTSVTIAKTLDGSGYAVLIPDEVTPGSADVSPYFTESLYGNWRLLNLPLASSVREAINYTENLLINGKPVMAEKEPEKIKAEEKSPSVIRVPSSRKEKTEKKKTAPIPYTKNLTEEAKNGNFPDIYGRDRELQEIFTVLLQSQKSNVMLLGEPGVGKSALVEKLALLCSRSEVPSRLKDMEILQLDLPGLLGDACYKGGVEKNMTELVDSLCENPWAVLFIDEFHMIMETKGDIKAVDILKPELARNLRMIGATTGNEFKKYISPDQALTRRFSIITVEEPSVDETIEICLARLPFLEKHHNVSVAKETLMEIVDLSGQYFRNKKRPDSALTLLDRAMAAQSLKKERMIR